MSASGTEPMWQGNQATLYYHREIPRGDELHKEKLHQHKVAFTESHVEQSAYLKDNIFCINRKIKHCWNSYGKRLSAYRFLCKANYINAKVMIFS